MCRRALGMYGGAKSDISDISLNQFYIQTTIIKKSSYKPVGGPMLRPKFKSHMLYFSRDTVLTNATLPE